MDERARIREELISQVIKQGYPEEFGIVIADNLRTEKTMQRMIGYLRQARPGSFEEIVDEMLAILADRDKWVRKKQTEYYNRKYNEILYYGLGGDEEDEPLRDR